MLPLLITSGYPLIAFAQVTGSLFFDSRKMRSWQRDAQRAAALTLIDAFDEAPNSLGLNRELT
jgi:hypothetical protein